MFVCFKCQKEIKYKSKILRHTDVNKIKYEICNTCEIEIKYPFNIINVCNNNYNDSFQELNKNLNITNITPLIRCVIEDQFSDYLLYYISLVNNAKGNKYINYEKVLKDLIYIIYKLLNIINNDTINQMYISIMENLINRDLKNKLKNKLQDLYYHLRQNTNIGEDYEI